MFYRLTRRYVSRGLLRLPSMEWQRVIWINVSFCFASFFMRPWKYENRGSSEEWKEMGTSASLAGRCCNADNRIINVSNKFEKLWHAVWMSLLFYWSLLLFILNALIQKQEQRVVLDGSKIMRIVLLRKRASDTVDILHEVQTRRKGFSSVNFPLRHFQAGTFRRQAHVRGVTRWEGVILNYELVLGECFPFNLIWEIPFWPRKNGNCGEKLLPTRIQNCNFVHPL